MDRFTNFKTLISKADSLQELETIGQAIVLIQSQSGIFRHAPMTQDQLVELRKLYSKKKKQNCFLAPNPSRVSN